MDQLVVVTTVRTHPVTVVSIQAVKNNPPTHCPRHPHQPNNKVETLTLYPEVISEPDRLRSQLFFGAFPCDAGMMHASMMRSR